MCCIVSHGLYGLKGLLVARNIVLYQADKENDVDPEEAGKLVKDASLKFLNEPGGTTLEVCNRCV